MPSGLIFWEWDQRIGAEVLAKFPESAELDEKTMMQLYSQHLYTATADIVELTSGNVNIISVWTGSTHNLYLSLMLQPHENAEDYFDLITDTIYYLIPLVESNSHKQIFKSIYHRFEEYPSTTEEQKMAILYTSQINRAILNLLLDEGYYFKEELNLWLNDKLGSQVFDIDMIIDRLSKAGLIKMSNVQDVDGNYLFLTKGLFIFRVPPISLDEIFKDYFNEEDISIVKEEIKQYFRFYKPNELDSIDIANILSQKEYYKIIEILRKGVLDEAALSKLYRYDIDNPIELMNNLEELNIIGIYETHNTLYYYLKSNIVVENCFPEFIFEKILDFYALNKKNKRVLLEYLQILRHNYYKDSLIETKAE